MNGRMNFSGRNTQPINATTDDRLYLSVTNHNRIRWFVSFVNLFLFLFIMALGEDIINICLGLYDIFLCSTKVIIRHISACGSIHDFCSPHVVHW